jgi:hypothetical protein
MKLQGPKGCNGASVGGQFFQADDNGVIDVPDDGNYLSALAPHGFTLAVEKPAKGKKAAPQEDPPADPEPEAPVPEVQP